MIHAAEPGSLTDIATDWIGLLTGAASLAAVVWGAVLRATKPLRTRLDEIHRLAEGLNAERERVDDLSDKVAAIERRVMAIERRVEDLYHLLLSVFPTRGNRQPDDAE